MKKSTIWAIVLLVGGYIICQAIADVGATKFIQVQNVVMPAGTFIFAVTFTLRDLLHKRLGKDWARAAIVCAGLFNIVQAVYLAMMARLPYPVFFELGDAWTSVFSIVPAITAGSIAAEVISELVDTEVYHAWKTKLGNLPQWSAVLVSNIISLPLDSFMFGTLAFVLLPVVLGGDSLPFLTAMDLVKGQIIWKTAITVVSLPAIYLVKEKPIV